MCPGPMKNLQITAVGNALLLLAGCEPDPVPVTVSSPVHEFTAKEESRYKSAAWEAASSPAMRARFKVGRLGSGSIQWTPGKIRY
jgi:hypothetical protein